MGFKTLVLLSFFETDYFALFPSNCFRLFEKHFKNCSYCIITACTPGPIATFNLTANVLKFVSIKQNTDYRTATRPWSPHFILRIQFEFILKLLRVIIFNDYCNICCLSLLCGNQRATTTNKNHWYFIIKSCFATESNNQI